MLTGDNFGEAVKKARSFIYEKYPDNNTWGAYQCYGDPFFKIKNMSKSEWEPHYIVPEEAEIHLDNMINDIEMGNRTELEFLNDLEKITKAVKRDVGETSKIIDKQSKIYLELGRYEEAIVCFKRLLKMDEAKFSFSSMEKYCNIRAKLYTKEVYKKGKGIDSEAKKTAYKKTIKVIEDLQMLLAFGETGERLNLLGSTYKRLGMLAATKSDRIDAFKYSISFYQTAYIKAKENDGDTVYPLTNALEVMTILRLMKALKPQDKSTMEDKKYNVYSTKKANDLLINEKNNLEEKRLSKDYIDYWDMVASLNLDFCLLLINNNNQKTEDQKWESISEKFHEVWDKAGSEGKKNIELEHLKFLIYAMKTGVDEHADSFIAYKDKATSEDLALHIKDLRTALKKMKAL